MKSRVAGLLAVVLLAATAYAQRYTITDLGPLNPRAINTWGQIVGDYNNHAYIWTRRDGMRDLGLLPGGTFSTAADINDLGVVTGTANGVGTIVSKSEYWPSEECSDLTQPFVWKHGTGMKGLGTIPFLPLYYSPWYCYQPFYATGINLFGNVVGYSPDLGMSYQIGFLWTNSTGMQEVIGNWPYSTANAVNNLGQAVGENGASGVTRIGSAVAWKNDNLSFLPTLTSEVPWIFGSGANDVNDLGQIVGWADTTEFGPFHAVLWVGGEVRDLGTLPGDEFSCASKINYFGQVIGSSGNTPERIESGLMTVHGRPFIWTEKNGMQDLNELIPASGWVINSVSDINVWGQIVGLATRNGEQHGVVLTPRGSLHF